MPQAEALKSIKRSWSLNISYNPGPAADLKGHGKLTKITSVMIQTHALFGKIFPNQKQKHKQTETWIVIFSINMENLYCIVKVLNISK